MNIVEPILYQCKLNPFAIAIGTPGSGIGSVRYGELERLIHSVARSAIRAGLAPGDIVAVHIIDSILHAVLILGLMRVGIVTMSLTEPALPEHIKAAGVITEAPQQFSGIDNVIAFNAGWLQGDSTPLDYERVYRCKGEDECRIILTSGTTGRQKGTAFTHRMLIDRIGHYQIAKGGLLAQTSKFLSDVGISSVSGFNYLINALSYGSTIYFSGRDIIAVLQYLDAYKIEGLATSPHNLNEMLTLFEADPALECSLKYIICLGARLSKELLLRAGARMCQNLYNSYGTTETSTIAFGPAHLVNHQPGAVGFICAGVTVEVVDREGRLLPRGSEGSLRIRSPHMARGYVGDPETTAQMFRGGAFCPGDVGSVNSNGMLVLTGREKSVLSIGGDKIAPEIIEEILCSFPGVEQAAAFNIDDSLGISRIHALVVTDRDFDETAARTYCETKMHALFVPVSFTKVDDIPRGNHGKIDRERVIDLAKTLLKLI